MQLHEYQAKEILKENNVPVPDGKIAATSKASEEIAISLGGKCVVKAQVHAGGRGKAGGIKVAKDPKEVFQFADQMLGSSLKTFQSGDTEFPINKVYIEKTSDIHSEYYLAVTMDFDFKCPVIIFSTEGGMNIEEVAEKHPDKIIKIHIDPLVGPSPYKIRDLAAFFKFDNLISSEQWNENGETEPVDEEWKESVENINKISENPIDAESIHKLLLERLLENSSELLPESN